MANSGWVKGVSGDPGGRPKSNALLRAKCREFDDELVKRLVDIARGGDNDSASIQAIKLLWAYGHGAPVTTIEIDESGTNNALEQLTVDELRAIARRPLSTERQPDDSGH